MWFMSDSCGLDPQQQHWILLTVNLSVEGVSQELSYSVGRDGKRDSMVFMPITSKYVKKIHINDVQEASALRKRQKWCQDETQLMKYRQKKKKCTGPLYITPSQPGFHLSRIYLLRVYNSSADGLLLRSASYCSCSLHAELLVASLMPHLASRV